MKGTVIAELGKPRLKKTFLIEGLPGMGYVGKLAAEHIVEELHAKKFAEMTSPYFPNQVVIDKDGLLRMPRNEFYWARADGKNIIIWTGDVQPILPEGHYEMVEKVLGFVKGLDVKQLFTLGGYATGKYSNAQPKVVAMGEAELLKRLQALPGFRNDPIIDAPSLTTNNCLVCWERTP